MSDYFTHWKAEDTQREYVYHEKGKSFTQLENHVECMFCRRSGIDMIGQSTSAYNKGVCLDCFNELKKEEKELKEV